MRRSLLLRAQSRRGQLTSPDQLTAQIGCPAIGSRFHRFIVGAAMRIDLPVGQILTNIVSRDRLIVRKIACA